MKVVISSANARCVRISGGQGIFKIAQRFCRITISKPGIAGPPGPAGGVDPLQVTRIAQGAMSGHRAVKAVAGNQVSYASADTVGDAMIFLGVTTTAADSGENIAVVTQGRIVEPSWNWVPDGRIFIGANGVLTQDQNPSWAFTRIVAIALSATEIFVNPQPAIFH